MAGWRHIDVTQQRTKREYAHCLKDLVDVRFPEADLIRVVEDNLNTHTPAALYEVFEPEEARRIVRKLEFHHSGRITTLRYYEDGRKWVFILSALTRYFVECTHPEAEAAIALGNQVMITGSLFSRRTRSGCDSGSICAEDVLLLAGEG